MANSSGAHGTPSTLSAEELFIEPSLVAANHIPNILPHERVFPVQLGSELFKLSGASISSDGACSSSETRHFTDTGLSTLVLLAVLQVPDQAGRGHGPGHRIGHPHPLHRPRPGHVPRHLAAPAGLPRAAARL